MRILVAGGTGRIGTAVVTALRAAGHQAVAGTPSSGVNTISAVGLARAAAGADAVLDVTDSPSSKEGPATAFFRASTRNLHIAEAQTGVRHHVALSVVGADRVADRGYYRAKLAQERAVQHGDIPFTIVRSTPLFETFDEIVQRCAAGEPVRLPRTRVQPIALDDLAAELARLVVGPPVCGVVEVAGPTALGLDDLARRLLRARHDDRVVVPRSGGEQHAYLPGPGARITRTGWESWLRCTQAGSGSVPPASAAASWPRPVTPSRG
jgi:uncharacterized protein YbjT (DUF2867 family)